MKKNLLLLFVLIGFVSLTYAQKGDLYVGIKDGYVTNYKGVLFGAETGYHLTDPLEVSFSFLMNPRIVLEDRFDPSRLSIYSFDLNFCYYIVSRRNWGMGPTLGGGYVIVENNYFRANPPHIENDNHFALDLGWHLRYSITDNIRLSGGWRYSAATNDMSMHLIYLGLGYVFNLF